MELEDLKVLQEAANILREVGGDVNDPNRSKSAHIVADVITNAVMRYQEFGPTPDAGTVPGMVFMLYYSCGNSLTEVAASLGKSYQYVRAINADLKRRYPLDEDYLREMFREQDGNFEEA